jgi:hypothetical protein
MDADAAAERLLVYLGGRITAVVGNNAPRIAAAIGLTVPELEAAAQSLVSRGLATETPVEGSIRRWAVTDAGIALLNAEGEGNLRPRPWWRMW